jgi:lycopene cyclase domain-containing protein
MTYGLLNIVFLAIALAVFLIRKPKLSYKKFVVLLVTMTLLTAVFDNLIIQFGIVAYNTDTISEWYVFKAPVEDFSYTLAACLLVPALMRQHDTND